MNRELRRSRERDEQKQRKAMWPGGFVDVPQELKSILKDGVKFTISGVSRASDGTITLRCRPGDETVFTARNL